MTTSILTILSNNKKHKTQAIVSVTWAIGIQLVTLINATEFSSLVYFQNRYEKILPNNLFGV